MHYSSINSMTSIIKFASIIVSPQATSIISLLSSTSIIVSMQIDFTVCACIKRLFMSLF